MQQIRYRKSVRVLVFMIQSIATAICLLGVGVCLSYNGMASGTSDMLGGKAFEKSVYYEELVENKLYDLAEYVHMCAIFESNGEYNPDKIIDVENYVKRNIVSAKEKPDSDKKQDTIYYVLEDLIKWGKEGMNYENLKVDSYTQTNYGRGVIESSPQVMESSDYNDILEDAATQNSEEIAISEQTSVISEKDEENTITLTYLDEYYLPADGVSLVDRIHSDEERQKFYGYLEAAIAKLTSDYESYKTLESEFHEGNSNLYYLVVDFEDEVVYSNDPGLKSQVDLSSPVFESAALEKKLKNYGTYFFLNSVTMGYDTSMSLQNGKFVEIMKSYNNVLKGNYYVAATVNTNFNIHDKFYTEKQGYEKIQPWYRMACFGAVAFGLISFVLFLDITFMAGKKEEDGEVILYGFDKIKTEIAIAIMGAIAVLEFFVLNSTRIEYEFSLWNNLVICLCTVIADLSFLAGYLSLVRRIKTGQLWKNSIIYAVLSLFSQVFQGRKSSTRMALLFSGYLIVVVMFEIWGFVSGDMYLMLLGAIGISLFFGYYLIRDTVERDKIITGLEEIVSGNLDYKISTDHIHQDNKRIASSINNISKGLKTAVMESTKNERMKTDLITNVSHDIKTPLTSIINYVGLIKREEIDNERVKEYVKVLENKSERLKHLTEDLVEASKISSGNISLQIQKINLVELVYQTAGEFDEKFDAKDLSLILNMPKEPVYVMADGRRVWRIIENLYNNVAKYALAGTRVYADLTVKEDGGCFSIKNISQNQLNFDADQLTERFIRGDVSRSTEGSGLGLSIAKSLTELQDGKFEIYVDGDLFRATVTLPMAQE